MKRILVLALAACLFLLPALSLADARDATLSLYVNENLGAGNEFMAAVIDTINVLGFRAHTQDNQLVAALTLSGEDALDFAFEADESNVYVAGGLLGSKTLVISMEALGAMLQQLPIASTPDMQASVTFDNTIAALNGALEQSVTEITEWDAESDKADYAMNLSLSAENAVKVLDALETDLSAVDYSGISLPVGDNKPVSEQISDFIAACKAALPEGEVLAVEIGLNSAGEVVYVSAQANFIIKNDDGTKGATLYLNEARTTRDTSVCWDGGITFATEGSEQSAFIGTSFETADDSVEAYFTLNSVDESEKVTPIGAYVFYLTRTETEAGSRVENSNTLFTYDEAGNAVEMGELHLLLASENDVNTFKADVMTSPEGPILGSLLAEGKPGETEPSRITAELYPITEFNEETVGKIIEEVVSENIMTVVLNAVSKLPPSASSLVGALLGQ